MSRDPRPDSRMRNNRRRRSAAMAMCVTATCMLFGALTVPVGADPKPPDPGDEYVSTLTVVVKADSADAADRAARKFKGRTAGEPVGGRDLYRIVVPKRVKAKDLQKKTAELADKAGKEKGVSWATPDGSRVDDDRFYAWRFYAWPSGAMQRQVHRDGLDDYLDLEAAHQTATGKGVVVAVLDTGFDVDHPLLERQLLPGLDLVDGDDNVGDFMNGKDDDGDGRIDEAHGHGTFVAGLVARVAPDALILPIRVLDADGVGQIYAVVDGIDAAVALGADVINLSFGMAEKSKAIEEAVKRAKDAGVIVVAAAGNQGSKDKQYPAGTSDVLSVAAFDRMTESVAAFGSRGGWVDVSAPGVNLVSARPGGGKGTWSGSSLAAPIVAGQVALIYELDPTIKPKDARKQVRETARKASKKLKDDVGVIDLPNMIGRFY